MRDAIAFKYNNILLGLCADQKILYVGERDMCALVATLKFYIRNYVVGAACARVCVWGYLCWCTPADLLLSLSLSLIVFHVLLCDLLKLQFQ